MKIAPFAIAFSILFSKNLMMAEEGHALPGKIQTIVDQEKYRHAIFGFYVKDLQTGKVLFDRNSNLLFSPASTTKLFSMASLLDAYGDDYRFKTPIYADGTLEKERLNGNLVLVAQGDLTLGGRQPNADTISFTKQDHIYANDIPGVVLTKEDPLQGIISLATQVAKSGIKEIFGDVLIDDSLFDTTVKRGFTLTPIFINENLIDIVVNPTNSGEKAKLEWRPMVEGYSVENLVKTVAKGEKLDLEVTADETGHKITIKGTLPEGKKDIVRVFSVKDPKSFARLALIQELKKQGIKLDLKEGTLPQSYKGLKEVALWTSPPLSEYAKLVLKVSHNIGADLTPLLLASQKGKKSFDEGMRLFGDFTVQKVKVADDAFVFGDAAGGNENRLTPQAEIQLLEYMYKLPPEQFKKFFTGLPILGVDGSLEDFAKNTAAKGKVWAKPGTGIGMNLATGKLFLITQALSGYIEAKNGHLLAYMVVISNAKMPKIEDIFPIFEDESIISSIIYDEVK